MLWNDNKPYNAIFLINNPIKHSIKTMLKTMLFLLIINWNTKDTLKAHIKQSKRNNSGIVCI